MPNSSPVASARESLDTTDARTSLPPAFAWSHAYSFATSFANFFAMPAVPDAAADVSSDVDDNETCVVTGAAGAMDSARVQSLRQSDWCVFCRIDDSWREAGRCLS